MGVKSMVCRKAFTGVRGTLADSVASAVKACKHAARFVYEVLLLEEKSLLSGKMKPSRDRFSFVK